ncbi:hypothetical protein F4859DRAFT_232587 [Xylaria cf. heliscus]|nr:hypothetical protein F4859DRAFT_232587 [Xylaria cf. heliscus]
MTTVTKIDTHAHAAGTVPGRSWQVMAVMAGMAGMAVMDGPEHANFIERWTSRGNNLYIRVTIDLALFASTFSTTLTQPSLLTPSSFASNSTSSFSYSLFFHRCFCPFFFTLLNVPFRVTDHSIRYTPA